MMKTRGVHHELLVRECSMEEARGERPMDLRESVRVLQVTGCFPFPLSHLLKISATVSADLWWQSAAIWSTREPSSSSSRSRPKSSNFDPTFSLTSMVAPEIVVNEYNSFSFGLSFILVGGEERCVEEGEDELFEEVAGLVEEAEVCTEPLGNWEAILEDGEDGEGGGSVRDDTGSLVEREVVADSATVEKRRKHYYQFQH
jgi:hypothetical protein